MANKAITDLPAASSGQGADLVFLYQGGALKQCALTTLLENLAQMFPCASFASANLPSPAGNRGRIVNCTDGNMGGPALVISNGSAWHVLSLGDAVIVAPSAVTLGTPEGGGIPYTLPAVPAGADSLILQKADDNGGGSPNEGTWTDLVYDLGSDATGTDGTGSGGGSGEGAQNTRFHYRAKNTNGGAVGPSSSAVTVDLPAAPEAPSLSPGASSGDIDITTPGLPARATGFTMLRGDFSGTASGFSDLVADPAPSTLHTQSATPDVYCEAYVVAGNAYGAVDGAVGNGYAAS